MHDAKSRSVAYEFRPLITGQQWSTVDLWYLARELHEHGTTFNRRSALLVRPDAINSAQLFALFAQNRGFLVNAFSSFEEAVDWLLPSSEASAAPPLQSP